jgi:hypothetical protein
MLSVRYLLIVYYVVEDVAGFVVAVVWGVLWVWWRSIRVCGVVLGDDVEVRQSQWYCRSHQPTQIIPDYWNTHSKMWVVDTTQYAVTWVSRQSSFRNPGSLLYHAVPVKLLKLTNKL